MALKLTTAVFAQLSVGIAASTLPAFLVNVEKYPAYEDDLVVTGDVLVFVQGSKQKLSYSLKGADPDCTAAVTGEQNSCGIHIHEGESCDSAGGHFYTAEDDPWTTVTYIAATNQAEPTHGSTEFITTGYTFDQISGKTVVVHDSGGNRIACGQLRKASLAHAPAFIAQFNAYPGYSDGLVVSGQAVVYGAGVGQTSQVMRYTLAGVDPTCDEVGDAANSCGIHVHAGTSCESADAVQGHFYNSVKNDPWLSVFYVAKNSISGGMTGLVPTGRDIDELLGRVAVVHDKAGQRIACGVLRNIDVESKFVFFATFERYPGYIGNLAVSGAAAVHGTNEGVIISYSLNGVDGLCNGNAACGCMPFGITKYPGYAGNLDISGSGYVFIVGKSQILTYDLSGTDNGCKTSVAGVANACGIHIHEGKSCEEAGEHFFAEGSEDPWQSVAYETHLDGKSLGSTAVVSSGKDALQVLGRTVVVHDSTGNRIGCGIIENGENGQVVVPDSTPRGFSLLVLAIIVQLFPFVIM